MDAWDYGEQESALTWAQLLPCTGEEALWSLNGVWRHPLLTLLHCGAATIYGVTPKMPPELPRDTARDPSQPAPLGLSLMGSKKSTQGLLLPDGA